MADGTRVSVRWRSSRHGRRLLTLGLAALFVATVARRPVPTGALSVRRTPLGRSSLPSAGVSRARTAPRARPVPRKPRRESG